MIQILQLLGLIGVPATLIYVYLHDTINQAKLEKTLESKFIPTIPIKNYIQRVEDETFLTNILTPKAEADSFYVVTGENGTGYFHKIK